MTHRITERKVREIGTDITIQSAREKLEELGIRGNQRLRILGDIVDGIRVHPDHDFEEVEERVFNDHGLAGFDAVTEMRSKALSKTRDGRIGATNRRYRGRPERDGD